MALKKFYSVSEITRYIKGIMDTDILLSNIYIQGEISNLKHHYSGHMYFTLKDENSVIKAVMFKSKNRQLAFKPENGMEVILRGYISVYEAAGQYQIYVDNMKRQGTGDLYVAFEKLKEKLHKEGLFDVNKKKNIPFLPNTIAVVTSATGSVIRDIINVLTRRYPNFHLVLYPVHVQGKEAACEIANAIKRINQKDFADVIIIARGGGSLEELWPFNEEITARSIYKSDIPVISAVGHETDFTISDFVADLRAPTPSAAAELVMPDKLTVNKTVYEMQQRLVRAVTNNLKSKRDFVNRLSESQLKMPLIHKLDHNRMKCDHLTGNMINIMANKLKEYRNEVSNLSMKLDAISPLNTVNRGYALVMNPKDASLIKNIDETKEDDCLEILLKDGIVKSKVTETRKVNPDELFSEVKNNE